MGLETIPRHTRSVADYTGSVKLLGVYLCDIIVSKILNTQNDTCLCYPNPRESNHTIFVHHDLCVLLRNNKI